MPVILTRILVWLFALGAFVCWTSGLVGAQAQTQAQTSIAGVVRSQDGSALGGVTVHIEGPASRDVTSAADGSYRFDALAPGIYRLSYVKTGFVRQTTNDVLVAAGQMVSADVTLQPASFSSLRTIGRIETASRRTQLNTTTASVSLATSETFAEQGTHSVQSVLNEIPGITTILSGGASGGLGTNGADPMTPQLPSIRGALPYETASLIDGHPLSVGNNGAFSPVAITPFVLQDVEVIKGPGATAPEINYAIGGSVNYRTIDPTRHPRFSADISSDQYGGISSNFRATGTLGKFGYAFDYGVVGTPGPNFGSVYTNGAALIIGTTTINGQAICNTQLPGCPLGVAAGNPAYQSAVQLQERLVLCCWQPEQASTLRNELAKIRYDFSAQTSLVASYLGSQDLFPWNGKFVNYDSHAIFAPYAGYSGSIPAGSLVGATGDRVRNVWEATQQNLGQIELRSTLGSATLLGRYYTGGTLDDQYDHPFGSTWTQQYQAWGAIPLGPNGTLTNFNGDTISVASIASNQFTLTDDYFRGYTFEIDQPFGENLLTLSYDRSNHNSFQVTNYDQELGGSDATALTIPGGSGVTLQTILARFNFALGQKTQATLSNYLINYTNHYTTNGGATFADSTHGFYGPRLGVTYRTNPDTVLRLSLGSSIAPPFVSLLTVPSSAPRPNINGAPTYYTQQISSGTVLPETAFGYDVGADTRFGPGLILSGDVYLTALHNQYLQSTTVGGTYLGLPLYQLQTQNLGSSQYRGIELAVRRQVPVGIGAVLQGALQRAYAYNVPQSIYATANGPYTANLGVVPSTNFFPSGVGFNGLGYGRVPYAQGYGEVNYRTRHGQFYLLGVTYYGPNNSLNQSPFGVITGSIRVPVTAQSYLQVSGQNLSGAYDTPYASPFGGIAVPLVNNKYGFTSSGNIGPATFQFAYHIDFGQR